jgi:hypothetical protein
VAAAAVLWVAAVVSIQLRFARLLALVGVGYAVLGVVLVLG